MLIYLTPILPILVGKLISQRAHEKYSDAKNIDLFLTFFPFLLMAVIVGLRGQDVGVDTINYLDNAKTYQTISYKDLFSLSLARGSMTYKPTEMEIGYCIIAKFLYDIFHSTQAIILFMAFSTYFSFWISANYLSEDPFLSTLMVLSTGFFVNSITISRQLMVVGMLSVTYIFILKKKWVPTILLLALSLSFHQTAILGFLAMAFIRIIPIRRKNALMLFALNLAFIVLIHPISIIFVQVFPKYASFLSVKDRLSSFGLIRILWLLEILITFYFLLYAFDNIEKDSLTIYDHHLFSSICFTYFYIGLTLCSEYVWLVYRVGLYFQIGTLFIFPMLLRRLRNNAPKSLYFIATYGTYCFFILWYIITIKNNTKILYTSPWLTI